MLFVMGLTKKQKEFYDYICQYIKKNGHSPTQKEMKDHFELKSFGSVQKYLQYLHKEGLLETSWNQRRSVDIKTPAIGPAESEQEQIPLLGMVAAGNPTLALEDPTHFISVPKYFLKGAWNYFALTVKGDSMIEAGIFENDIVVCRSVKEARNGQIVVAIIDGEATLKTIEYEKKKITLLPHNKNYQPIIIDSDTLSEEKQFKIVGLLVGLLRSYL